MKNKVQFSIYMKRKPEDFIASYVFADVSRAIQPQAILPLNALKNHGRGVRFLFITDAISICFLFWFSILEEDNGRKVA